MTLPKTTLLSILDRCSDEEKKAIQDVIQKYWSPLSGDSKEYRALVASVIAERGHESLCRTLIDADLCTPDDVLIGASKSDNHFLCCTARKLGAGDLCTMYAVAHECGHPAIQQLATNWYAEELKETGFDPRWAHEEAFLQLDRHTEY